MKMTTYVTHFGVDLKPRTSSLIWHQNYFYAIISISFKPTKYQTGGAWGAIESQCKTAENWVVHILIMIYTYLLIYTYTELFKLMLNRQQWSKFIMAYDRGRHR